ncbi:hypothetical protein MHBO_003051 [Bonamia ostreae]|uniref:Uncharacterized protein n=1 Tax=Bonamia ostreae TaxID=126728 RepID=A0ABV2APC3_9EUKA
MVQMRSRHCARNMHPLCAWFAGLKLDFEDNRFSVYCHSHSNLEFAQIEFLKNERRALRRNELVFMGQHRNSNHSLKTAGIENLKDVDVVEFDKKKVETAEQFKVQKAVVAKKAKFCEELAKISLSLKAKNFEKILPRRSERISKALLGPLLEKVVVEKGIWDVCDEYSDERCAVCFERFGKRFLRNKIFCFLE